MRLPFSMNQTMAYERSGKNRRGYRKPSTPSQCTVVHRRRFMLLVCDLYGETGQFKARVVRLFHQQEQQRGSGEQRVCRAPQSSDG
jgi:hypothetical protein